MVSVTPRVTVTSPVTSTFWLQVVLVVICPLTVEVHVVPSPLSLGTAEEPMPKGTPLLSAWSASTTTGPSAAPSATRDEISTPLHTQAGAQRWLVKVTRASG